MEAIYRLGEGSVADPTLDEAEKLAVTCHEYLGHVGRLWFVHQIPPAIMAQKGRVASTRPLAQVADTWLLGRCAAATGRAAARLLARAGRAAGAPFRGSTRATAS